MRALVFDTETTGLVFNRTIKIDRLPEIIEFGGVIVNLETGDQESVYEFLAKPKLAIPKDIIKITNITNEMVADQQSFETYADQVQAFFNAVPLCIAHNMSFDRDMIDIEFERMGRKFEWPECLCSVEQTVHLKGFRLSLGALYEFLFNETFKDAHRAPIDVQALVRCCVELKKQEIL